MSQVYWIHRSQIKPNAYNPNAVAPAEMDLLKYSVMRIGWVFPILLIDENQAFTSKLVNGQKVIDAGFEFTIVDGFHRFTTSGDGEVMGMTEGYVPVTFIPGDDVMQYTVMMNRAKGSHHVLAMSNIVVELLKIGRTIDQIKQGMGMDKDEIIRLAMGAGITKDQVLNGMEFSKSWKPK